MSHSLTERIKTMTTSDDIKTSKFLSLVLRHKPDTIGLSLDSSGWAEVNELIAKSRENGILLDAQLLHHIVETNSKQRFIISKDQSRIRANQGHSINIELGLKEVAPPDKLYHGTSLKSIELIKQKGLLKINRQHVHLSDNYQTAVKVGIRHGKPIVLTIHALKMYKASFIFFISENGVWLTENVPSNYIVFPS